MPNWTSNKLTAPKNVIEKYINTDKDGKPFFDFKLVIPRPEIYDDPELLSGYDTDWCVWWYLSNKGKRAGIFKEFGFSFHPDMSDMKMILRCQEKSDEYYRRGEKYVQAYDEYGYKTWYDWSYDNWGTKWNACDTVYDGGDTVEFMTAWCYPEPVINKILKDNPGCEISFTWEDEDYDGTHTLYCHANGTVDLKTEWKERDEDED